MKDSSNLRFSGRHVFITGGARGIGREIAKQFAEEGANLSIIDTNKADLDTTLTLLNEKTPGSHFIYQGDITQREKVNVIVDAAEAIAPIDVLINNAGIAFETPFLEISTEEWEKVLNVNLTGFFHVSQLVCRYMVKRKRGIVINMSSKNGLDGEAGYAHYNASKAGIIMLTKTMALEFAHVGIRVNAVCPGYIETPLSKEIDSPEFTRDFVNRYIPMNRPGAVEDIAPVFLFLADSNSSFITGQIIIADGGQLSGQKPGKYFI
ncbi:MAG: SDR family oxidoreductase [Bacteroidetes bacterium]|nr:SDR family oxidoreductase [Bacteroidota bacterium]